MKKTLCLALLVMMLTGLAVAASAITTVDLSIPKVSKLPVIDGKFDPSEGWGTPVSTITFDQMNDAYISDTMWEGDEEILPQSVTTYLLWDETHLYFCSVIVDPIHYYDTEEGDLGNAYAGDGFQFDIKSMADDDTGNRNRYFYGLNVDEGYIVVNQDKVELDAEAEGMDEPGWSECAVTRDEGTQTTTYETVFDLSLNLPEKAISEGSQFYVRSIVLCCMDSATEDIVDVNVPGMVNGDYAYWLATAAAGEGASAAPAASGEKPALATVGKAGDFDDIQLPGTNTAPVIDGKLDDCYVKIHDFYAPDEAMWYDNEDAAHEAKGEAWGTWDKDNFYAFFKVEEEDYFPQNGEADPPGSNYSSMYLALLATPPVNDLPENDLYVMQCSFNRSIEDTKEWKYTGSVPEQFRDNSGAYAIYDTCPFDFEVVNDGVYTYYEVKMPWDQIDRTGEVDFSVGHKWFFNYIITFTTDSGHAIVQYGQGLMNDIYDMGGLVTLTAAPGGAAAEAPAETETAAPAAAGERAVVETGADGSLQIPKTATPMVMDGDVDDGYAKLHDFYGSDGFRTDYDADKTIKGTSYTAWDDNYFYMLLDVETPEYEPIFDTQAIDMGIGPAGYVALLGTADGSYTDDQRFEIGIALADENIPVWKVSSPADIKDSSADNFWFDECPYNYAVKRDEATGHIFYEFGIPWSFLDRTDTLTYAEGSQFILNYAANVHTTSDYSAGASHIVEFGGGIWAGAYTDGQVATLVAGPAAAEAGPTELLNKSWDNIFVDGEMMVNGGADGWLADNPVEGDIADLTVRGWAYISTPITGFAYTVDDGEAVKSADYIVDRPDVKAAISEAAEGFEIAVDVSGLGDGAHTLKFYALDANGELIDTTFALPFTKGAAAAEPETESRGLADVNAAADGKAVITGYEFVSGTESFGGEGPENLFDGETSTKFCTNVFPAEAIAKLDGTYNITGFTMATANDNADYNGRSPNAWTISVSADGENWTELAKGDDSFFEETNFTYYAGEGKADGVSYVKFNADGTASGTFQVSELTLFGDKAEANVDETLDQKAEAPNTFDFGILAAVASVISLGGFALTKKRH